MMKKSRSTPVSDTTKARPLKISSALTGAPKTLEVTLEQKPSAKVAMPARIDAKRPISDKGKVSFQLIKPGAKSVYVAGSFNDWKPEQAPLAATSNGRWVGDLTLHPGRHEYLFVVDGQWIPDPNAKESVQNPFGGRNSVIAVSE